MFSEMKLGYGCEAASRTDESLYEENDWQPHGRLCERNSDSVQGTRRTSTRPHNPARISESRLTEFGQPNRRYT